MEDTSIYSTKELGVFVGSGEVVEVPWALGGMVRAPASPPMHHHCIIGSWLAPKVGSLASTCEELVQKVVARSVDGLQVNDNGPMNP